MSQISYDDNHFNVMISLSSMLIVHRACTLTIPGTTLAKDHGNAINSPDIHSQNDSVTKTNRKMKRCGPAVLGLACFCCCCCFDNQNIRLVSCTTISGKG